MFNEYVAKKLTSARYKILKDGNYFGEILGLSGVWASAKNLEDCRKELKEVLEDWVLLKISSQETVPGLKLNIGHRQAVNHA